MPNNICTLLSLCYCFNTVQLHALELSVYNGFVSRRIAKRIMFYWGFTGATLGVIATGWYSVTQTMTMIFIFIIHRMNIVWHNNHEIEPWYCRKHSKNKHLRKLQTGFQWRKRDWLIPKQSFLFIYLFICFSNPCSNNDNL